jgi:hypothetical protein
MIIQTAFGMTAIGDRFVILSRKLNVLLDFSAVLETETKIICAVWMTLECRSLTIMCHDGEI